MEPAHTAVARCAISVVEKSSTTLADFYGSFVDIVYGSAGMLAAEAG